MSKEKTCGTCEHCEPRVFIKGISSFTTEDHVCLVDAWGVSGNDDVACTCKAYTPLQEPKSVETLNDLKTRLSKEIVMNEDVYAAVGNVVSHVVAKDYMREAYDLGRQEEKARADAIGDIAAEAVSLAKRLERDFKPGNFCYSSISSSILEEKLQAQGKEVQ